MAIADDATIRINPHELRILTIWASNWAAQHCGMGARQALAGVLGALSIQLPGVPLTMGDEIQQLADGTGSTVSAPGIGGGVFEPRKPS